MKETTIIIPSFQQVQFLADAIESALGQTVTTQVIVVDDGTTDGSLELVQKYEKEHPNLKVIAQENKGLSEARNAGIKAATTQYVSFLDADDIYQDDYVEKVMAAEPADVIAPSFKEFGLRNGQVILGGFTLQDLVQANRIGYFSTVKREILLEVGGFNPEMKWGWEDWALWIKLMDKGKTFNILTDMLVLYRVKADSMIHTANAHAEELIAQLKKDFSHLYQ